MADADLDEVEAPIEDDEPDRAATPDPAPQCAGCHRRGIELTLLENGKRYCERCAQEVERLMGIGPLFPTAEDRDALEDPAGETAEPVTATESEPADTPTASDETATEDEAASDTPVGEASAEEVHDTAVDEPSDDTTEDSPADGPTEVAEVAVAEQSEPDVPSSEESDADQPETATPAATVSEPAEAEDETPDTASEEPAAVEPDPKPDLSIVIAGANHEAANSSNPLIPRPETTSVSTPEEPPLMERVQEQTRPARAEAATSVAAPPSDLLGALAAERSRLLDQRELLEARFRAETSAIDERLLHVESLLGDQSESIAS